MVIVGDSDLSVVQELHKDLRDNMQLEAWPRGVNVRFAIKKDMDPEDIAPLICSQDSRGFHVNVAVFQSHFHAIKEGHSSVDIIKRTNDSVQAINVTQDLRAPYLHSVLPMTGWIAPHFGQGVDKQMAKSTVRELNKFYAVSYPYMVKVPNLSNIAWSFNLVLNNQPPCKC